MLDEDIYISANVDYTIPNKYLRVEILVFSQTEIQFVARTHGQRPYCDVPSNHHIENQVLWKFKQQWIDA
jgi:hypothetical protein